MLEREWRKGATTITPDKYSQMSHVPGPGLSIVL